jgi:plasmid stability protein
MPVDFSVKRVPDAVARHLRERAERNHRSLQRELLSILEAAAMADGGSARVAEPRPRPYAASKSRRAAGRDRMPAGRLTLDELWQRARQFGGPIPGESAASLIRRDRDERSRR